MNDNDIFDNVISNILAEFRHAENKHPGWPDDLIHAVGIITEECGEAMQLALDITYGRSDRIDKLQRELAQTAAVSIRAMIHIEKRFTNENQRRNAADCPVD